MFRPLSIPAVVLTGVLCCWSLHTDAAAPRDIVLLVETAYDLAGDEPGQFFQHGMSAFLHELSGDTRIAVLGFDKETRVMLPLTPLTIDTRERILATLRDMDYGTELSNSAIALERAIYELKNNGRATAELNIIFIGSAVITTGNTMHDAEFSQWLREELLGEAVDAGIRVFWVVPAAAADFKTVQTLTHKSGGTYFRAAEQDTFYAAFTKLAELLSNREQARDEVLVRSPVAGFNAPAWLAHTPTAYVLLGGMLVFGSVLTVIIVWRIRHRAGDTATGNTDKPEVKALLRDLSGFTGKTAHELKTRHTSISRRPGLDSNASRTLVIDDSNISRNHALIECRSDGYWITDPGSVNGTYVNDERVTEGRQSLHSGDIVRFARYEFEFVIPDSRRKARIISSTSRFPGRQQHPENDMQAGAADKDVSRSQTETNSDAEEVTLLRPKK